MDATGAEALRWRMEQQAHWRLADAVRDGRQPAVDPDGEELVKLGTDFRLYAAWSASGRRVRKRLADGLWQTDAAAGDVAPKTVAPLEARVSTPARPSPTRPEVEAPTRLTAVSAPGGPDEASVCSGLPEARRS